MLNKIIETLFDKNESKIAKRRMTVVKNNRMIAIKEKTEKDDLSLSVYFKNNKGLNKIERSSRLHVAYLI
ncbi:MAG: hypothetical protein J6C62_10155 [Clostridia bacterium]|nr:hypothetical protein [Clostridia bacterium]